MKGNIQKRVYESGTVKYRARIDVPTTSGQRKPESETFDTKEEAERWLTEMNHKIDIEGYQRNDQAGIETLSNLLDKWLQHKDGEVSARTLSSYKSDIENHIKPTIGNKKLSDLDTSDIQTYYDQKKSDGRLDGKDGGLAPSTIHQHHTILNSCFGWAVQMNLMHRNPIGPAKPPKIRRKKMKVLDEQQIANFLNQAEMEGRFFTVYCVAVFTGARRGEILGLEWNDIDFDKQKLTIQQKLSKINYDDIRLEEFTKTDSSSRTIRISKYLTQKLEEHRNRQQIQTKKVGENWNEHDLLNVNLSNHAFVFTEPHGKPIHPDKVTKHFKRLAREMDLGFAKFHHLRHSHVSIMLKENTPINAISKRLGHKDVSTTLDKYSHLLPGMEEEAVENFSQVIESALDSND